MYFVSFGLLPNCSPWKLQWFSPPLTACGYACRSVPFQESIFIVLFCQYDWWKVLFHCNFNQIFSYYECSLISFYVLKFITLKISLIIRNPDFRKATSLESMKSILDPYAFPFLWDGFCLFLYWLLVFCIDFQGLL